VSPIPSTLLKQGDLSDGLSGKAGWGGGQGESCSAQVRPCSWLLIVPGSGAGLGSRRAGFDEQGCLFLP
jgi:hypothetical protein